jgi:peroxiredoxin
MSRLPIAKLGRVVAAALCLFTAATPAADKLTGQAAPAFELESLGGGKLALDSLRGKRVLVAFWATWCGSCQQELPELDRAQRAAGDKGFVVLAVNVGEPRKKVADYIAAKGLGLRVLLDPDWRAAERFGVIALPESFLIDERGSVRERIIGGQLTREKLAALAGGAAGAVSTP